MEEMGAQVSEKPACLFKQIKLCKAARRERVSEMGWLPAGDQDWLPPVGKDGHLPIRETHMLRAVP